MLNNSVLGFTSKKFDSTKIIVLDEKDEYIKLEELLEKQQLKMQRQYGGNNNYKENKLNDLNARLGNAILRELREYDKNLDSDYKVIKELEKELEEELVKDEKQKIVKIETDFEL